MRARRLGAHRFTGALQHRELGAQPLEMRREEAVVGSSVSASSVSSSSSDASSESAAVVRVARPSDRCRKRLRAPREQPLIDACQELRMPRPLDAGLSVSHGHSVRARVGAVDSRARHDRAEATEARRHIVEVSPKGHGRHRRSAACRARSASLVTRTTSSTTNGLSSSSTSSPARGPSAPVTVTRARCRAQVGRASRGDRGPRSPRGA